MPSPFQDWPGSERIWMETIQQNDKHIITTGGSGFGLMAILVGIERGFITRERRDSSHFQRIVNFLDTADRFHGAWPHWLNGPKRKSKTLQPER